MEKIIRVKEMFETIKNTSSTNDKKKLLVEYGEDGLFIKLIKFILDTNIVTGISKAKMNKKVSLIPTAELNTIDEAIEYICKHNSGKDEDISNIQAYIQTLPIEVQEFYKEIFTKSFKLGANTKLVNSVITGLIPTFECMLGSPYDKNIKYVKGKDFILTTKLDGSRILVIVDNKNVKFITRQGKIMDGLSDLEKEFRKLPIGVYDGELLAQGIFKDNKEQFAETMKLSRIKGIKTGLKIVLYDYISNVNDFYSQVSTMKCVDRKNRLKDIISTYKPKLIEYLEPLYIGNNIEVISTYMKQVKENNEEGLMLNIADSTYQYKRTKDLLKIKVFSDCDIRCVRVEEGDGRLKNTLGKIICDYKGFELAVGSGFTDDMRNKIWNNPDMIVGKIVKVQYFEESENQDGGLSLRFPVFLEIREDKNTTSYN